MTSRREFLQIGIAASAWPIASKAARAAGLPTEPPLVPIYKVVYDTRFAASVAFARRAEALGLTVAGIAGDMTRLWFDDIHHRWNEGPAAIAGLTAHGPLFCFERLAWDQRMRVVFRAEHKLAADGGLAHALSGPVSMLHAPALAESERDWAACMADVVTHCPAGRAEIASAAARTAASRGGLRAADDTDTLYSWVIAPASKV